MVILPKQKKPREKNLERYIKRGKKLRSDKKWHEALRFFDKALELNDKCAEAYFERGMVYDSLEKNEEALKNYDKAIQLDSSFGHAYVHRAFVHACIGKYDQALKDIEEAYKLDPKLEVTYLLTVGNIKGEQGHLKQALDSYEKALKLISDNAMRSSIFNNMGIVFDEMKQHNKALSAFNKSIELDSKNMTAYLNRGSHYAIQEQFDKAIKNFESAMKLEPNSIDPHLAKGMTYRVMSQFENALDEFGYALELEPRNAYVCFEMGVTYERLRQFDKALELYDQALVSKPNFAHVYTHKGIVYGNLGEHEEAIRNLSEAIKLNSKEEMAYLNRGVGYANIGKYDLALKDFEMTIKLEPSLFYAYIGKGSALCFLSEEEKSFKKRKQYDQKVIECFRKAYSKTKNPQARKLAKWWINFYKRYCDASAENKKRLSIFANIYANALEANLFSTVTDQEDRLVKFMDSSKTFSESECFFQVLRRWNSFTPVIPGESRSNLGGGYFLAYEGYGIVIDPGYNFVENFIKNNFSLGDIDAVILTHAHDDHTADFEAILSLFSKSKVNKKIGLFMNLGASVKFSNLISKNEPIIERIEILNEDQTYQITSSLEMKATKTVHRDILTETSGRGLLFGLKIGSKTFNLGITGDTTFYLDARDEKGLDSSFKDADVLVSHLGSIHEAEFELVDNFVAHKYDGEHLGIRGVVNLIFKCRPKLAIISEFGEELRELRTIIASRVDEILENYDSTSNVRVIPGDIGLKVVFDSSIKVKCEICGASIELKDVAFTETLINHKIAYHCKRHKRKEIVDTFKRAEEKELRIRAESMGCSLDLRIPRYIAGASHKHKG